MNVILFTPWKNKWKDSLSRAFQKAGHNPEWTNGNGTTKVPDVMLSMWCNEFLINAQEHLLTVPLYTYIRHYEVFSAMPSQVMWNRIKGLFFCARHVQFIANQKWPDLNKVPQYLVNNWLDPGEYPLKKDLKPNKKIAMVGRISPVKNYPLAILLMKMLPDDYTLDIAGEVQEEALIWYLQNSLEEIGLSERVNLHLNTSAMLDKVIFHDHVEDIQTFLSDKTFILSTSYREGCPMNVLEAMSVGLKPIIHNWFGSREIFGSYVWDTLEQARDMILSETYEPHKYHDFVLRNHGLSLADKVVEIVSHG